VTTVLVHHSCRSSTEGLHPDIQILGIPPSFSAVAGLPVTWKTNLSNTMSTAWTSSIAHYFHTSGTSSGLPKPVAQTQFGAVGALPRLPGGDKPATFTTTPLYHGGLADCFRAWTSGAMIWMFPEAKVPVTGGNVLKAFHFARKTSRARISYFSSVPYVLQMLLEEGADGIELLRDMDIVGFGGAALPKSIGDKLVDADVRLISRMGSAECGFLMSSYRDFTKDREWGYLRPVGDPDLLAFEARDDGLAELVIKPGWPLREKQNREDGSYATADLFEPHPSIPNAWRYHSRADAQIALDNGKKFDPSPIEEAILASHSSLLDGVLVFGAGRSYPGALLFTNDKPHPAAAEVVDIVWPTVEAVNKQSPYYARLAKTALIVVVRAAGDLPPLEKSSKGTIMRGKAETRYAKEIESAYSPDTPLKSSPNGVSEDDLPSAVREKFREVIGAELDPDMDLYAQGVDSMACNQVRRLIERDVMPDGLARLPTNLIYDRGSINSVIDYLLGLLRGDAYKDPACEEEELQLMQNLVDRYSKFGSSPDRHVPWRQGKEVAVLTGATGALGAHLLYGLLRDTQVDKVYCLVRAADRDSARARVMESLSKRGLSGKEGPDIVVYVPCSMTAEGVGLSSEDRNMLKDATMFIHAAWPVNFSLRLSSFEAQFAATRELIILSLFSGGRFLFISSTAAVSSCSSSHLIPEKLSADPQDASPLGYSRSKWVAEQICGSAYGVSQQVSIIRVGQLCGNAAGIWNASEAWPLLLSTAKLTGCLPGLDEQHIDWLPMDQAAQAIIEIAITRQAGTKLKEPASRNVPVYHVLNPHQTPSWQQMLQWIAEARLEPRFEIVHPTTWIKTLEIALVRDGVHHPSRSLLHLWKEQYSDEHRSMVRGDADGESVGEAKTKKRLAFDVSYTQAASNTMSDVQPLDKTSVERMWKWIQQNI
jgi:thioester reductase-like protein